MTAPAWFCAAHHLWTTSDCPRCDDELIEMTEADHHDYRQREAP